MSEKFTQSKEIRSADEINKIISEAVNEVIELFAQQMSQRDADMLFSVVNEKSTNPYARIVYLRQIVDSVGVSAELTNYVNQALQTIKQKFTQEEIDATRAPFGGTLLTDIT